MKIIFRNTKQPRPYADSYGSMLVKLEDNETKEEVIEIFKEKNKNGGWWYDSFDKELSEYEYRGEIIKGNLLLFKSFDRYTG